MSNQTGPWPGQPLDPADAPSAPGWAQPGSASAPPPAGYGQPAPGYPGPEAYGPNGPAYGPPPGYPAAPGYGPAYPPAGYALPLRTDYARWGKRVAAMLIDNIPTYIGLVVFYLGYFLWLFRYSVTASSGTPDLTSGVVPMLVGFVIMLAGLGWTIYNRWLVAGRTGQSLGKRVTKIRLVSEQTDAPIGPANAFIRDLVHILDGMAYVGYLWPLWDDKKQTFADKIVRTVVVTAS